MNAPGNADEILDAWQLRYSPTVASMARTSTPALEVEEAGDPSVVYERVAEPEVAVRDLLRKRHVDRHGELGRPVELPPKRLLVVTHEWVREDGVELVRRAMGWIGESV